jgi:hypothetical protein
MPDEEYGSTHSAELLGEQLRHMIDLLRTDIEGLERERSHDREIYDRRIDQLEKDRQDHEQRIRSLQDSATSFKVWSGLASGGSTIAAIAALLKAWFGG